MRALPHNSGSIIVFNFEGKEVGLVVTEIVDVVEIAVNLDQSTFDHQGILGSNRPSVRTRRACLKKNIPNAFWAWTPASA